MHHDEQELQAVVEALRDAKARGDLPPYTHDILVRLDENHYGAPALATAASCRC